MSQHKTNELHTFLKKSLPFTPDFSVTTAGARSQLESYNTCTRTEFCFQFIITAYNNSTRLQPIFIHRHKVMSHTVSLTVSTCEMGFLTNEWNKNNTQEEAIFTVAALC